MKFSIEKKGYNKEEVDEHIEKLSSDYESTLAEQKQRIFELKKDLVENENAIKAYKEKSGLVTKAIYNAVAKAEEIERLSQIKYNQEIKQLKAFHEKWIGYYNKIIEQYPVDSDLLAASKFNNQMKNILSKVGQMESEKDKSNTEVAKNLEKNFDEEYKRLSEKRIGYIKVSTGDEKEDEEDDNDLLREMLPDIDFDSPIITGNFEQKISSELKGEFDPIDRINKYFNSKKEKTKTNEKENITENENAAAQDTPDYKDRSESGFSFQEALNPQEDLEDIMRDLGLLLDEN